MVARVAVNREEAGGGKKEQCGTTDRERARGIRGRARRREVEKQREEKGRSAAAHPRCSIVCHNTHTYTQEEKKRRMSDRDSRPHCLTLSFPFAPAACLALQTRWLRHYCASVAHLVVVLHRGLVGRMRPGKRRWTSVDLFCLCACPFSSPAVARGLSAHSGRRLCELLFQQQTFRSWSLESRVWKVVRAKLNQPFLGVHYSATAADLTFRPHVRV